jgi:ABC-2 type transport system ATP-binding protein
VSRPLGGRRAALSGPPRLALEAVTKSYGRVQALRRVTLTAEAGSVVGLVGPNGSGKTTALRVVVGLVRPDAGRVLVNGVTQGSRAARSCVAFVPDEPTGLDELTISEFVGLCAALYEAGPPAVMRARRLLTAFDIADCSDVHLGALSHGRRRLAAMVAAFALARPLVVIDEATAALDPEAVLVLRETLPALAAEGAAVLLATQDLHFAETVCDRLFLLSSGSVVAAGAMSELRVAYDGDSLGTIFLRALGRTSRADEVRDAVAAR